MNVVVLGEVAKLVELGATLKVTAGLGGRVGYGDNAQASITPIVSEFKA